MLKVMLLLASLSANAGIFCTEEYLLQTAMLNINGPMTVVTLGAYHGAEALRRCEDEAVLKSAEMHTRWWCVRSPNR